MAARIIERGRGPEIAGTRITVYAVMDYTRAGDPIEIICEHLGLTQEEAQSAIDYIAAHREECDRDYDAILARPIPPKPEWVENVLVEGRNNREQWLKTRKQRMPQNADSGR